MRHIQTLQLTVDPWYKCAQSSVQLFDLSCAVTKQHTQLCSRLANFDGLVRFFSENAESIPRADMLGPMPELENAVKASIEELTQLIRDIQNVAVQSGHRDQAVKTALIQFTTAKLSQAKLQFSVSTKSFDRLTRHTRAFSPPPRSGPRPATPTTSEIHLEYF